MIFLGALNRPRKRTVRVPWNLRDSIQRAYAEVYPRTGEKEERSGKVLGMSYMVDGIIVWKKKGEGRRAEVVHPSQEGVLPGFEPNRTNVVVRQEGRRVTWRPRRKVKTAMEAAKAAVAAHLEGLSQARAAELKASRSKER